MRARKIIAAALACLLAAGVLAGCQQAKKTADFGQTKQICELATVKTYYHNVVRVERDKDVWTIPFINLDVNWFRTGYKKMWYEYTGTVDLGIDASKVSISQPDANGNVTITIPKTQILSSNIEEGTLTDPVTEKGFLTDFSADEKTKGLQAAQEQMRTEVAADDGLLSQARERAKSILSQYVVNTGSEIGQTYTVTFVDAE